MKDKILALLIAKFSGVRKDGLAQLAASMSLQIEKEEDATALIEKLTDQKVNDFIKDWRKEVDKEVSDANKTFKSTLEKKYKFVEKEADDDPDKKSKGNDDDETPKWAKDLIAQNKALSEKLQAIESGKTTETRLQQLQGKFKDKNLPESLTSKMVKDFKRMNFETDEAFAEYLTEVESDITAFNQELVTKGLVEQGKPFVPKGGQDDADAFIETLQAINAPQKES